MGREEKLEYFRNSLEVLRNYRIDPEVNITEFEKFKEELFKQIKHKRADRLKILDYYEVNKDYVPF